MSNHRECRSQSAIDDFLDWLEHWDLPLTEDSADEYVTSIQRGQLSDYEREAVTTHASDYGTDMESVK